MTVAIILGLIAVIAIAFFVLRSKDPTAEALEDASREALPEPAKPAAKPTAAKPAEPAKPDAAKPKAEPTAAKPKAAELTSQRPPAPDAGTAPRAGEPAAPEASGPVSSPAATPSGTPIETLSATPEPASIPAAVPAPRPVPSVPPPPNKDLSALRKGLKQTRGGWVAKLVGLFGGKKQLDPALLQELEESLIMGDVGVATTQSLLETLKDRLGKIDVSNEDLVWATLRDVAREVINVPAQSFGAAAAGKAPLVILVVGVNGVGKTTTIGKLAARYKEQGKKVYLAAGDTFRAAAVAQLEAWGKRVGVLTVKGKDLSKPGAVVFDAVQKGAAEGADVVIADTAGRLHTKTPLMEELRKLRDAATKALPGAPHEILLVLDATTGQNGLTQVREFREALPLTGVVLTKLDGTAKGGVILGICDEFKLPVRFVGVGEKVDDLREFDAEDFTQALFGKGSDDDVEAA